MKYTAASRDNIATHASSYEDIPIDLDIARFRPTGSTLMFVDRLFIVIRYVFNKT